MNRFDHRAFVLPMLALLALSACGRGDTGTDAAAAAADEAPASPLAPLAEAFEGEWQGVLPCVDCEGLDVELTLVRDEGAPGRFQLLERYLGRDEGEGFLSEGEWREEPCALEGDAGRCLVLVEPGQRWFRRDDGSLQAITADGQALDPDGARLMRR